MKTAAQKLAADAEKAKAAAVIAKQQVRAAKAELKRARKASKAAKKTAKNAAGKADAALAALRSGTAPSAAKKSVVVKKKVAETRPAAKSPVGKRAVKLVAKTPKKKALPARSAAEVAKSVIERLQSPPPALPPEPKVPPVGPREPAASAPPESNES